MSFEHSYPNNQNVFNDNRANIGFSFKKAYDRVSSNTSQTPSIFGTMDSVTLKHFFREASKRIQQISVSIKL
uniref:Uncharacterized protein n=1 Tax=Sarcoptes scabiei TaxID=52283 RepID=A0A834RI59_SARSC